MNMRLRGWVRVGITIAVGLGLATLVTVLSSPVARAKTSGPVYFFSDNGLPINSHNPLVVRPSGFLLFLDGSWVLQDLHWTGWGSSVARATGISNASNDIPDVAGGKRIKTWADMTLSSPVRWRGHEVYSCFDILFPRASESSGCVLPNPPIGNGWLLRGAGGADFLAPGQKVWCGIASAQSFCAMGAPGAANHSQRGATLNSDGKVTLCYVPVPSLSAACVQNWDTGAPILRVGQETRADNVLCKSERRGIVCTIASGRHKGKGFLISSKVVRQLG
jgi:hypothetical protein